jgi:putative heme-binding domain-containing protein
MLTIDAVPTPQGDLLVACHSGQPDWGTGPSGKGKLFKISYADAVAAQPVLAFAAGPAEMRVVFDRPLYASPVLNFTKQCAVTMGRYVTAGERFESFRPGYQVVKYQQTMPRFESPILSARAEADNRTFVVRTGAAAEAVNYGLTLPGSIAGSAKEMDVLADLTGVTALWKPAKGGEAWSGWLPHLDLTAARGLTVASAAHDAFFNRIKEPGTLTLRARLDLWQMLHPAVQPESKLDYEYPPEKVTVVLKANSTLTNSSLTVSVGTNRAPIVGNEARITTQPKENRWLPLEVTLETGGGQPSLDVSWFTAEDPRLRPFPLRRILLPWAKPHVAVAAATHVAELDGGDWERGRKIFFGDQATCYKCHQIRGEGGEIGANLSNLIYRDYASVLRDITEPSAAINPEHIAYAVTLKDGSVETGVVLRNDQKEVVLGQVTGKNLTIPKEKVAGLKASAVSLMPEGLWKALNGQQQKDLMTFLLTSPPADNKNQSLTGGLKK